MGGGVEVSFQSGINLSMITPAEHNFEHNTLVSRVTPKSIILYFTSIIRQTLQSYQDFLRFPIFCLRVTRNFKGFPNAETTKIKKLNKYGNDYSSFCIRLFNILFM